MASKKQLDSLRSSLEHIKNQAAHREKLKPMRAFDWAGYRARYEQAVAEHGREIMLANDMERAPALQAEWDKARNPNNKK